MTDKKPVRKALGRGLGALISTPAVSIRNENIKDSTIKDNSNNQSSSVPSFSSRINTNQTNASGVIFVAINKIAPNESQPRKEFRQEELQELSDSIKALGVIQPIIVRKNPSNPDSFQIVAGERRWRASSLAGLSQVPVIIKDLKDKETLEIALVENIQRQNLNAVEEARAYQALIDEFSLTQKDLSDRLGKNRSSIANYLRILKLPNEVLDMIASEAISMGHAKSILSVKEPSAQINLAKKVVNENLSVHSLENIVGRVVILKSGNKKTSKKNKTSKYPEIEDKLKNKLGTKVKIKSINENAGSIEISYFSKEELERIIDLIL